MLMESIALECRNFIRAIKFPVIPLVRDQTGAFGLNVLYGEKGTPTEAKS